MTNSDFYVKSESYRKKQGKILEGNGVVFDHGLISMLWRCLLCIFYMCWVLWKPQGRGGREQSMANALMCKPEQVGVEMQSKQRSHLSKERQRSSPQSSCRDSRKAFPRAMRYNLWPGGPLKFCSYHKMESFSLLIFLWVMFKSCHVLLL